MVERYIQMTRVSWIALSRAVLCASALLAAACVSQPVGTSAPTPVTQPESVPPVVTPPEKLPEPQPPVAKPTPSIGDYPKTIQAAGASAGVLALYRQAQASRSAGKFDAALGQLERALRIEPRNPFIWQALAEVHLQAKNAEQATSAAQKSSSYARGNPYLEAGNWRLIGAARLMLGDAPGARHANARADELAADPASVP
jgi:tetratricopeptide (TPR) repeat protein